MVFLQSALLYTTSTGRRRVRISTMGLIATRISADVFRSADLGTVAAITRRAVSDFEHPRDEGSLHRARANVLDESGGAANTSRVYAAPAVILPESAQEPHVSQ
mmetsp:Transcript_19681/g.47266  ORF Transcript_19681/g.47266 Transcript_19681/m.47266 type:complete len:104 (+) Transcript_19681:193-504(+)